MGFETGGPPAPMTGVRLEVGVNKGVALAVGVGGTNVGVAVGGTDVAVWV